MLSFHLLTNPLTEQNSEVWSSEIKTAQTCQRIKGQQETNSPLVFGTNMLQIEMVFCYIFISIVKGNNSHAVRV